MPGSAFKKLSVPFSNATVILRGYTYEQVKAVAEVLLGGSKVRNMEITLNTDGALETIEKISDGFGDQINVGAGTVLNLHELKMAHARGATFMLSPDMMTAEMISYCAANDIISIPSGLTPSEIRELFRRGADVVKVFPANELSHGYAKKVCEPLGDLSLMAVGGVNASNVNEILAGGYRYVGSAGGIFRREDILAQNSEGLARSLAAFEAALPR